MAEFLHEYRRIFLAIMGAIMTAFIPLAIAQEYFRYNPYVLPILGFLAIMLFLSFFITGPWWSIFYHKHIIIGKVSLIGVTILIIFGELMWIIGSINYVTELKIKDIKTKALLSTYSSQEIRNPSKEEIQLLVNKAVQEHIKAVRGELYQEKFVLPQLGERGVLKIKLREHPKLQPFTWAEMEKIPITAQGKILRYVIDVNAYAGIADSAIKAHEDYERNIFGGEINSPAR
jgi:hypothetical protein